MKPSPSPAPVLMLGAMANQWRYTVFIDEGWDKRITSQELRKLGLQGWELVTVLAHPSGQREFWFKQPTTEQA